MRRKQMSFRVGRVRADLRGTSWYLSYHQHGQRHRPRVGPDRQVARQLAARINSQLEAGGPAALGFQPITIADLRARWLEHHEQVRRSSVQTIRRYRAASDHLLRFVQTARVPGSTTHFQSGHAEQFVRHLRTIRVAPNGHKNARKRPLLDKGVKYVLEACRAMFNYALKHRHLAPYAENPFAALELDHMPVEIVRPIVIFTPEQEREFLQACDDWQFPVFLTLTLTGLRPGELVHLLLPQDIDLEAAILRVHNKPKLGWKVKTRNERDIPLVQPLVNVLRVAIGARCTGPVFRRRRFSEEAFPLLDGLATEGLERELASRVTQWELSMGRPLNRQEWLGIARAVWRDAGVLKTERIRTEFMRLAKRVGLPHLTAPKLLRHLFATCLQDANVDPLVRNELMGHSPGAFRNGRGLGMTATYTHTRPGTKRRQLEEALQRSPGLEVAGRWLRRQPATMNLISPSCKPL